MVRIGFGSHDFPFNIMDVAALLRLNIRRRGPDHVYSDCPICGDRRGKMNLNLIKNVWRCNYCNEGGGMLALYGKVYGISNSEAYREICDALLFTDPSPQYEKQAEAPAQSPEQAERAEPQAIHQTFSMLLSMLSLTQAHREHLRRKRGLSDEQIERFRFKSTPPPYLCRSLTERLIKAGCTVKGVPGFYVNDAGKWTVKFYQRTSGILIPVLGVDGQINGIQVRLDHPLRDENDPPDKEGAKYLTLSSSGKPMGTSSGSPVHFIGDPCSRVVYVTEGPLKAYIAHELMQRTFAATLGAGNTNQLEELFRFLAKNGTELIMEAGDMDKYSNQNVDRGTSRIYLMAKKYEMECRRLTWNPNYKGIDDWQLALRRKKQEGERIMNFKQQYLHGRCEFDHIEQCTAEWHDQLDGSETLVEHLGLTQGEYDMYLRTGDGLEAILDNQRHIQRFRIYQLDFSAQATVPFAFRGIKDMRKAGFEQPPAAKYALVHDGEIMCPNDQTDDQVLERVFSRYNDNLPSDYHGHSVSVSDVLELYDDGRRNYYYCDNDGFAPVQFSPLLAKRGPGTLKRAPRIDGRKLMEDVNGLSSLISVDGMILHGGGQPHLAEVAISCDGGVERGQISFGGETQEAAYASLVNAINERLARYADKIREMQLRPKGAHDYQACKTCGGTRLYRLEFRTDNAPPRLYDPVNEGTPEISQDDVPCRVGGTYCMDCDGFCETETRFGDLPAAGGTSIKDA